jgi:hypothetical protein
LPLEAVGRITAFNITGIMRCPQMNEEERRVPGISSKTSEEPIVEQELLILPDGRVEIAWITPEATRLVLEIYQAVSNEPFPVKVISGNLYCG